MSRNAHAALAAVFLAASLSVASGAAAEATKFDGTYEGTMTGQSAAGASHAMGEGICADRLARSIAIAEGKVSLLYNLESNVVLNGVIDVNGLFSGEAKRKTVPSTGYEWTLRMSGSVVGDYLTGQVWGKTCAYRIQMRKVVIKPS
jgi:hypothetical protein